MPRDVLREHAVRVRENALELARVAPQLRAQARRFCDGDIRPLTPDDETGAEKAT